MLTQSKLYSVIYNDSDINVLITKKSIKSLRLKINNNAKVSLSIPNFYPYYKATDFINSKLEWIANNLKIINQKNDNSCNFKNNSKVMLWGQIYSVCIQNYKKDKIELIDNNLMIYTKNLSSDYIYKKFVAWAKKEFLRIASIIYNQEFYKTFEQYGFVKPKLSVRTMKSMWGNCKYNKPEITLNLYLIKTPFSCLRYVIVHELTHLLYHDHSAKFKAFLTEVMPEWKTCKNELKNYPLNF